MTTTSQILTPADIIKKIIEAKSYAQVFTDMNIWQAEYSKMIFWNPIHLIPLIWWNSKK